MQSQYDLTELARLVMTQNEAKRDYIADTEAIEVGGNGDLTLAVKGLEYPLTDYAHGQVAARLGIPKKYYDRMRTDAPDLLRNNVRTWFRQEPKRVMVRTLEDRARAVLSDSYRPMDNDLILQAALPALIESELEVRATALTETRLYVQAVSPRIEGEVKPGDVVQAGLVLSNSEVGAGAVKVEQLIWRLVCMNGMIRGQSLRRNHVGRSTADQLLEDGASFYRTDTVEADNRAFLLKIRDTVRHALTTEGFEAALAELRDAADRQATRTIPEIVEVTQRRFSLGIKESENVLTHLAAGGDLSAWGLANAITATARGVTSGDRAIELERLGGDVIEMRQTEWNNLYVAA